ncbi:hypothetical protein ACFX2G_044181 [Malus domestica]
MGVSTVASGSSASRLPRSAVEGPTKTAASDVGWTSWSCGGAGVSVAATGFSAGRLPRSAVEGPTETATSDPGRG